MSFSPMILAFALFGAQPKPSVTHHAAAAQRTCASVAHTGTFRVVTKRQGSSAVGLGLVVLENIDGCLEATFITDDGGPAVIEDLSSNADSLEGSLKLSSGLAKLTLEFTGTSVAGSIVEGRNQWTVEGRKTS